MTIAPPAVPDAAIEVVIGPQARQRWFRSRIARALRSKGTIAFVVYGIISLAADWPIYPGDPHLVPTMLGEDIYQTIWFLRWTPYALAHGLNLFGTNIINYPAGVNLAQNTGVPLLGLLATPLTIWVSPIASLNLLRWLAFTLSAFAAFAVLRRWVKWTPAAFVGGLIYGFSPYMVTQGSVHLNLSFVPLPPVILYLAFEIVVRQGRNPWKQGLLLGLCTTAQYFISAEVLATTALITGIGLFYLFFLCIHDVRRHFAYAVKGLGLSLLVALPFLAYPVWAMTNLPAHYLGAAQGLTNVYNADLLGPILPTTAQLVAPHHLASIASNYVGNQIQENGSYLGIPLLVVAIYFLVKYWRQLWGLFAALMAASAFVLSLGPMLIVNGRSVKLPFSMPFKKLERFPIIDNVLPVRFSLYVALFVTIIVVLGLDALHGDLRRAQSDGLAPFKGRSRRVKFNRAFACSLLLISLVALFPRWPYQSFKLKVNGSETPRGLAVIPNASVVLTYPYSTAFADAPMLWQALSGMRFSILGSYALVPDSSSGGTVSAFPAMLQPSTVEAMFVNSITPIPDPDLPDLVATARTIYATRVVVEPHGLRAPKINANLGVSGRVESIDPSSSSFVVDATKTKPVGIIVRRATVYVEPQVKLPSLAGVAPGQYVVVEGSHGPGTVTPAMVQLLRQFIARNHVTAVVVGLGLRDSAEIAVWMRDALGRPTRAGDGGEVWIDFGQHLRSPKARQPSLIRNRRDTRIGTIHSTTASRRPEITRSVL